MLTFRLFFEEQQKADYFDGLADEFGIDREMLDKIMQHSPQVTAHFQLGNLKHKLGAWEIVKMNPDGSGVVRLKNLPGERVYRGNRLYKGEPDNKLYPLSRQQLIDFLTTGWQPALQAAQAGGMGGAPGGMPGGDMGGGMPPGGGMPAPGGM